MRQPDVPPARQLPLLPHLWARECFCGFMGRLSDGRSEGRFGARRSNCITVTKMAWGRVRRDCLVKSRLALLMRILEGLRRRPLAHDGRLLCDDETDHRAFDAMQS